MAITTARELAAACEDVAKKHKTLYVMGCFGSPMTSGNKTRYTQNHSYNRKAARTKKIKAATADTFGFDCVNLIKGLLWGWSGNAAKTYGGASYQVNGVPDISANQMIKVCKGVTTDFSTIEVGEAVWMEGHIGVYTGNGLCVECSPKWADGVQITAVGNVPHPAGYNVRTWTKHGRLPYVSYAQTEPAPTTNKKEEFEVEVPVLRKGDKGEAVEAFQKHLLGHGYKMTNKGKTYGADGSFGQATENALEAYQKDHGLDPDGIRGPATFRSMNGL